ncbi:MAG: hypothetical protein DRI57_29660 [Deltaproteobacteria bacterium]|nr:MAG: hypothetical protein DRI57_29660 [Deltaproteobacteria bacterium]
MENDSGSDQDDLSLACILRPDRPEAELRIFSICLDCESACFRSKDFDKRRTKKMEKRKKQVWSTDISLTSDLRGKQSVRATFRLSEGCIAAISIVATHLGIKQKSLFDHLVEDSQFLNSVASEVRNAKLEKEHRVQKTYVMSRNSLYSLEEVSRNFNASRDALVEYSVQRLLPIIEAERKKHEKRKEMLTEIRKHLDAGRKLLDQLNKDLGNDDPIYDKLGSVWHFIRTPVATWLILLKKGRLLKSSIPS